jgi:hypothetical protein
MRVIHKRERTQRGCIYCADVVPPSVDGDNISKRRYCPHSECPYHELDGANTYTEYLKSISDVTLNALLKMLCMD